MRQASAHWFLLGIVIAIVAPAPPAAGSDATRAEALLKSKKLERDKGLYLLKDAEEEALEKSAGFKSVHDAYRQAQARVTAFEQSEQMLKATTAELANVAKLMSNLQRHTGNLPRRHSAAQAQMKAEAHYELQEAQVYHSQLQGQLNELKGQVPKADEKKTAAADLKKAKDELLAEFRTAKDALDPVADAYRELAQDKEIKLALEAIRVETKAPAKLGPSRKFLDAVKHVEGSKAAGHLSSMKGLARSKGGSRP